MRSQTATNVAAVEVPAHLVDLVGIRVLVPHVHLGYRAVGAFMQPQLVEGRHAVTGSDFTCVDPVIAEVAVGDVAGSRSLSPIAVDDLGIEGDLNLGVLGDHLESGCEVVDE